MYLFSDRSLVDMTTTNRSVRSIHIIVYIWLIQLKVALGVGNWVLGSHCLVVTPANHYVVPYDLILNCQLPMPKATFIESAICIFSIYALIPCVQPPLPSKKSERSSFPIFWRGGAAVHRLTHSVTGVFQAIWVVRDLRRYIHCTAGRWR